MRTMLEKNFTPIAEKRRLPGSSTVEGALVIPIFVYAVMAVLYLLQVLSIKNEINIAAYNSIRTISKYDYAYEQRDHASQMVPFVTVHALLISELGADYGKEHYIVGGTAGIVLLGSTMPTSQDSTISVTVRYAVKNPFDIFGVGIVPVTQTITANAWLGAERIPQSAVSAEEKKQVFITVYGRVYHETKDCAYLALSVKETTMSEIHLLRNQSGGKYTACERCCGSNLIAQGEAVYITDYGERYHKEADCSKIKRTVMAVPYSFVKDMNQCKKCGQSERISQIDNE